MNKKAVATLIDSQFQATVQTAESLIDEIKTAEVIPYETGNLQESLAVEANRVSGEVSITQDTEYTARLYYHPEYNFRQDFNKNAQGEWWQPWISGGKMKSATEFFRKYYRKLTGRYVK